MKKPVIGISSSVMVDNGGMFPGYERAYVNKDYVDAVVNNGGVPFIIPLTGDKEVIKAQIEMVDALILSGGHDVYPLNYNEEPKQRIGQVFPERDYYDFELLKNAKKKGIPILGVCRGLQIMNVYEGGSLYQDLSYIDGEVLKHSQNDRTILKTHTVELSKKSKLYKIFKLEKFLINSFHHQAINRVGKNFEVVARAKDGVIEAIEYKDYPFYVGVQWHPEMLAKTDDLMKKLFKEFINMSKKVGNKNE